MNPAFFISGFYLPYFFLLAGFMNSFTFDFNDFYSALIDPNPMFRRRV